MCETRGVGQAAYHLGTIAAVPYAVMSRFPMPVMSKAVATTRQERMVHFRSRHLPTGLPRPSVQAFFGARLGKLADPRASLSRNSHTLAALPVSAKEAREECG